VSRLAADLTSEQRAWLDRALRTGHVQGRARIERTVPFWPIDWIERLQRRRLRSIVRHAYATVPFYRRAMDERGLEPQDFQIPSDLSKLPLIDGITVQEHPDEFLSTAFDERTLEVSYTSGSQSGVRRKVCWDTRSSVAGIAHYERVWPVLARLAGEPVGRSFLRAILGETRTQALLSRMGRETRMLFVSSADLSGQMSRRFLNRQVFMPERPPHHHFLSPLVPFEHVAERLNAIRPRIAFSFGSYADQFFRFLSEWRDRVALPRVWAYTGDTVSPGGRELAEETFGCLLHSSYNVTEMGRIGFQCERRAGHHLNVDLCAIRVIDEQGRTVPPGEPGEVVASSLRNRAMVLLNYRLGDRAAFDPAACPCGRSLPLLDRLDGRHSDVLTLGDGREVSSLALEALFRDELRPALKVQLAQPAPGDVRWLIVPLPAADRDALRGALLARWRDVLGDGTRVSVEFDADIQGTRQGKLRKVVV
jgi:phenylacetate-CoA ligase